MPESDGARCWSVYLVRCRHGSLYTGITVDVASRIEAHRNGISGAKYLRGRGPLELAAEWPIGDRSLATRVESRIKRMSRADKEALVAQRSRMEIVLAGLQCTTGADT